MPFVPEDKNQIYYGRYIGQDAIDEVGQDSFGQLLRDGFAIDNIIGSLLVRQDGLPDSIRTNPEFSAIDQLDDNELGDELFLEAALEADSVKELEAVRAQNEAELVRRRRLANGGVSGFAAAMIAGTLDPINLIPVGGVAYKTYRTGSSILKTGVITATTAAGSAGLQEAALQQTEIQRTLGESAVNVSAAALLGGVIGTVSGALARRNRLPEDELDAEIEHSFDPEGAISRGESPLLTSDQAAVYTDLLSRDELYKKLSVDAIDQAIRDLEPTAAQLLKRGDRKSVNRILQALRTEHNIVRKTVPSQADIKTRSDLLLEDFPNLSRRRAVERAKAELKAEIAAKAEEVRQRILPVKKLVAEQQVAAAAKADISRLRQGIQTKAIQDRIDELMSKAEREGWGLTSNIYKDLSSPPGSPSVNDIASRLDEPPSGPGGVGADLVDRDVRIKGSAARAFLRLVGRDPKIRTSLSRNRETRKASAQLAESPLDTEVEYQVPDKDGFKTEFRSEAPTALETRIKYLAERRYLFGLRDAIKAFKAYRKDGGKKTRLQFNEMVADALDNFDQHSIPQVQEAAQAWRREVYDPLVKQAMDTVDGDGNPLLPKDLLEDQAYSYLNRVWEKVKIQSNLQGWSDTVVPWLRQQDELLFEAAEDARIKIQGVEAQIDELVLVERKLGLQEKLAERQAKLAEIEQRGFDLADGEPAISVGKKIPAEELSDTQAKIDELKAEISEVNKLIAEERAARGDPGDVVLTPEQLEILELKAAEMERINQIRKEMVDALDTQGKTIDEIKAIKKQAEGLRKELKRLISKAKIRDAMEFSQADYERIALEIASRISNEHDGRLPYDYKLGENSGKGSKPSVSGPLARRAFTIPNSLVKDFMVRDVEQLANLYSFKVTSQIELLNHFKDDLKLTATMKRMEDEWQRLIKAETDPKQAAKLNRYRNRDRRDLAVMRDRIMRVHMPDNPNNLFVRIARSMRDLNYMRMMGGVVAASIPDVGRTVGAVGLWSILKDGLVPMARSFKTFKVAATDARDMSIGADAVTSGRAEILADITNYTQGGTALERGLRTGAHAFSKINLLDYWTSGMKQFHIVVAQTKIIRGLRKGEIDPRLKQMGISDADAANIGKELRKHAKLIDGAWIANARQWDSPELMDVWGAALRKESDRVILVPGQDVPVWMSSEVGKTLGQFRKFMYSATIRIAASNLQLQDKYMLQGLIGGVSFGMLSYIFKEWDAGREISDDPRVWLVEGFDRMGAAGWLTEVNNTLEKLSRGNIGVRPLLGIDMPAGRFASRSQFEALLGPSAGLLQSTLQIAGSGLDEEAFGGSDIRALRRLIPFNNLSGFRQAVDVLVEEIP